MVLSCLTSGSQADTPLSTMYQQACEFLLGSGCVEKAIQTLRALIVDFDMDLKTSSEKGDWVASVYCLQRSEEWLSE